MQKARSSALHGWKEREQRGKEKEDGTCSALWGVIKQSPLGLWREEVKRGEIHLLVEGAPYGHVSPI